MALRRFGIPLDCEYRWLRSFVAASQSFSTAIYKGRRDVLIDGLARIGWEIERPQGTMFAWAPIPEPYCEMNSIEFASMLVKEAGVAVSPGAGFGPGGEGFIRFALVENEQRIQQAMRGRLDRVLFLKLVPVNFFCIPSVDTLKLPLLDGV